MANNTAFDPFSQSFTLLLADGTPFNVSIPDLDDFIFYGVEICINYASQLGASLILLVMLALLTKAEKRSSPIFVLNCLSLALNFVRNVLQCLYFTGPFSETYAYFGQDYSRVPRSAYATSIAATVLTFMLLVCIELSLILQAHVICITVRKVYRQTITIISIIVAALACAIRLALCIENAKYTISLTYLTPLAWLSNATNVTTTISIFWFCAVFVTKLGFALGQRRKLGLRRFGPMQIIFIMGCQTLIIPAIFSILPYITHLPSMDSNVLTVVSIFLPLSSMWAASSIDTSSQISPRPEAHKKFVPSYASGSTASAERNASYGPLSPSKSADNRTASSSLPSPANSHFQGILGDLEAQDLATTRVVNTLGVARRNGML